MVKVDLKDEHFTIPIHEREGDLIPRIHLQGQDHLPFGLACVGWVFTSPQTSCDKWE